MLLLPHGDTMLASSLRVAPGLYCPSRCVDGVFLSAWVKHRREVVSVVTCPPVREWYFLSVGARESSTFDRRSERLVCDIQTKYEDFRFYRTNDLAVKLVKSWRRQQGVILDRIVNPEYPLSYIAGISDGVTCCTPTTTGKRRTG